MEVDKEDDDERPGRARKGRKGHFDDDDDIVVIPDLDEEGAEEEDITVQVAAAPKNNSRRVASLHELDSNIKGIGITRGPGGVDLSLLSSRLVPVQAVGEIDERWEFDSLLQSVTQEFHREKEREGEEEKEGEAKADAGGQGAAAAGGGGRLGERGNRRIVGDKTEEESKDAGRDDKPKDLNEDDAKKLDELIGAGGGLQRKEGGKGRRARGGN
jgi:hypothetical protein